MKGKRRHKRFLVEEMSINCKLIFAAEVKVLNISISGVSLTSDRRLEIGREYRLKLEDEDRVMSVKGVVVWSTISGSKKGSHGDMIPIYKAGIKFTDVLNDRVTELLDFMEDHKKDREQRLIGLRFNIDAHERAILNVPVDYRVKDVSLSGMLIESVEPLEIGSRFPMEVTLPDESPIKFRGRVASCVSSDENPGLYDIGIEFIEMSARDWERIKEFIRLLNDLNSGVMPT